MSHLCLQWNAQILDGRVSRDNDNGRAALTGASARKALILSRSVKLPSSGTQKAPCGVIDEAVKRNLKIMLSKLGFAVVTIERWWSELNDARVGRLFQAQKKTEINYLREMEFMYIGTSQVMWQVHVVEKTMSKTIVNIQ